MARSFIGGIHPNEHKEITEDKAIKPAQTSKIVVIPLHQHTGVPCEPLINVGDMVKIGQPLGNSEKYITAPVHASIAGKVVAIEPRLIPSGQKVLSVVIENDNSESIHESIKPYPSLDQLDKNAIRRIVRGAGIVGLGGAAFPTHVKLDPPHDKEIELVILNGCECEPYLTCDYRIMLEQADDVLLGLKAIMKPTDARKGIIAIEDNKPKAIQLFKDLIEKNQENNIEVVTVKTKYPQGGEKQVIKAVTGKEVPSGGLPMDVGIVVSNVGTAAAIAKTLKTGMPLIERVITITGKYVAQPANLLVRLGTSIYDLLDECGWTKTGEIRKIIMGGPMMGPALGSADVPVIKGTSGILVMTESELDLDLPTDCMRCGKCVDVCPQYLMPDFIADYSEKDLFDIAENYNAMDCIECGCCSYVCESKRNLVQLIKQAKNHITKKRREKASKK